MKITNLKIKSIKYGATLAMGIISIIQVYAQNGSEQSAFSKYGLGDPIDPNLGYMRQMANIHTSYTDLYHLNLENPAAFGDIKSMSFDVAIEQKISSWESPSRKSKNTTGNLSYLAIGFPFRNSINEFNEKIDSKFNYGFGFSLRPSTRVAYELYNRDSNDIIGGITTKYLGNGGTNKIGIHQGLKYGNTSVGLNINYTFGKTENSKELYFPDNFEQAFVRKVSNSFNTKSLNLTFAAMQEIVLNKKALEDKKTNIKKYLKIGITYQPKASATFNSTYFDRSLGNIYQDNSNATLIDTIRYAESTKVKGKMPSELNIGLGFGEENHYHLGFNLQTIAWSQYSNPTEPQKLNDSKKYSVGGFYKPNYNSLKYLDRVSYRGGFYIEKDGRNINDKKLETYGITAGIGLPFVYQRFYISHINLGVELGQRKLENTLSEKFFKLTASFNFNDNEWFIKRKYE